MIRESEAMATWARGTDYSGAACCAATRERGDYLLMTFGGNLSRPFRDFLFFVLANPARWGKAKSRLQKAGATTQKPQVQKADLSYREGSWNVAKMRWMKIRLSLPI